MDLMQLARIPVLEWPPNGGNVLHAVLDDRQAGESDRLLAAELAGEVTIIDDDLAGILLSLVGDAAASEPLRCRAAQSLGPVLEQMDLDSDDYFLPRRRLFGSPADFRAHLPQDSGHVARSVPGR